MGKLKDKVLQQEEPGTEPEPTTYTLKPGEFNYIMNLNVIKNSLLQDLNKAMSSYLFSIATDRLDYGDNDQLKFELDFEDDKHELKVWNLNDVDLYRPDKD